MADFGIYTKNADILALVGLNAGTTEKATAVTDVYVLNVEAVIDTSTGTDWSSLFTAGSLDQTLRNILTQAGAARCAMHVYNANTSGYRSREGETHMNFLNSLYDEAINILKTDNATGLVKGES